MAREREIVITNDDGFMSKGINTLARFMMQYGNVTVVAPSDAQSGKSTAISLQTPLYVHKEHIEPGLRIYSFGGTPVDCIKMAVNEFFSERRPDLLVSGINHGSNASVASLYSGTLGACIEGTIYDIPSIGFSINTHHPDPDLSCVLKYGKIILDQYFEAPPSPDVYLNVNFPNLPPEEIKGIRMARRGHGRWVKEYSVKVDEQGNDYYWMTGMFEDLEDALGIGDHTLIDQGYVTIVPHLIDTTDYHELKRLKTLWHLK